MLYKLLWCLICPFRLAKATLTLIPLFGIHEIIFMFATDEQTTGVLRYIKVFFTLFLTSFQVGLVEPENGGLLVLICVKLKNLSNVLLYKQYSIPPETKQDFS